MARYACGSCMSGAGRRELAEWFLVQPARAESRFRLFCFPYAGGGATVFHGWATQLPGAVEVHAARLPGRGTRLREPSATSMSELVGPLIEALEPMLGDGAYGFFGHSMGGRIAFELAREVVRRGLRLPAHLWVSA